MGRDHHFGELTVNGFKDFSLLRQLLPDVVTADKNVNENSPVLLHLQPLINHNVYSPEFLSPVLDNVDEELDVFPLSFHPHQIQRVGI